MIRVGIVERRFEQTAGVIEEFCELLVRRAVFGLDAAGVVEPALDDAPPEVLYLGEMMHEIGDGPPWAAGNGRLHVARTCEFEE